MDNNRATTEQLQDDEMFIRIQNDIPHTIYCAVRDELLPTLMDNIAEWSGVIAGKYGEKDGTFYINLIKNEVIKQLKI